MTSVVPALMEVGEKLSKLIGSEYVSLVLVVMAPIGVFNVTYPGSAVCGTVTWISSLLITSMSVISEHPGITTPVT